MKKLVTVVGTCIAIYKLMDLTWEMAMHTFAKKLVEFAEKHPEMTLAECICEMGKAV